METKEGGNSPFTIENTAKIENILLNITKPASYVALEANLPKINFNERPVRFVLSYPDLYEIGMSHPGGKIIYHVINNLTDFALCHRVFLPRKDMQGLITERDIPLFALESQIPVKNYDFLGFSLLTELTFTNVLKILELSHIPLKSKERDDSYPIIQAGGTCTYNPLPLSPFIDLFVIGDGEEVTIELAKLMKEKKEKNLPKEEFLLKAKEIEGVYIPKFGKYPVKRAVFHSLKKEFYPTKPIVPAVETVHDRITVEVMRGCLRGCRYCQAGFLYRPYRERDINEIKELFIETYKNTGYEEGSLLSLSVSDYSKFNRLIPEIMNICYEKMIGLSLPSMRVKGFNPELAKQLMQIRKSSFTIAPEAATERLRKVINKDLTNEDILTLVEELFKRGWNKLKFYFMIGLPTERNEDTEAIIELLWKIHKIGKAYKGKKHLSAGFSIFIPKAFTPFQWEKFISTEEAEGKIAYIKKNAPKSFKLKFHNPEMSLLEALLTRGDEKFAKAIELAHKKGCQLDSWTEHFDFNLWMESFRESGININDEIKEKDISAPLPWEFIKGTPTRKFLLEERKKAYSEIKTPDCRIAGCHGCGTCTKQEIRKIEKLPIPEKIEFSIPPKKKREFPLKEKYAVFFEKKGKSKLLSVLDLTRIFTRAFGKAGLPIRYQGKFNPHPKFSILLGIPTGVESNNEIVEIELTENVKNIEKILEEINTFLPEGLKLKHAEKLNGKESLLRKIEHIKYTIKTNFYEKDINKILQSEELTGRKNKPVKITEFIGKISVNNDIILMELHVKNGTTLNIQDFLFWLNRNIASAEVKREIVVNR